MKKAHGWLILIFPVLLSVTTDNNHCVDFLKDYCQVKYPKTSFSSFIYIGIKRQQLYLVENWKIVERYDVSTSRKGAGFEKDSEKTPWGLHCITQLIGKDVPHAGILQGAHFSGKIATIETGPVSTGKDEITSRAMRLDGMEPGLNKGGKNDSYARDIYIHGTTEEGLIGTASSHGCIRMRNSDIISLFTKCRLQLPVLLLNN
ncbi:MAG: L,D-transpeptidase family protein [Flavobacteriales bacterium]